GPASVHYRPDPVVLFHPTQELQQQHRIRRQGRGGRAGPPLQHRQILRRRQRGIRTGQKRLQPSPPLQPGLVRFRQPRRQPFWLSGVPSANSINFGCPSTTANTRAANPCAASAVNPTGNGGLASINAARFGNSRASSTDSGNDNACTASTNTDPANPSTT